jgi:lipoate-protein ligase A
MNAERGTANAELLEAVPLGSAFRVPRSAFPWRLIVDPAHPGSWNMAMDQALLEEADRTGAAFLRFYRWDPPCLSFGRNEPARACYDGARIDALGLDVVRRPTGGRAVWHQHEVTYAVAAPVAAFGSLREGYRTLHGRLAGALRRLGADATLAPDARPTSLASGACFAAPAGGEVLVGGRKVIGSAQVRRGRAFLQHGSILLGGSQEVVAVVSRQPGAGSRHTTVAATLGRMVSFEEVLTAIIDEWDAPLTPSAAVRPRPHLSAHFSDPAWTWRH